jgi:hypothetical protein
MREKLMSVCSENPLTVSGSDDKIPLVMVMERGQSGFSIFRLFARSRKGATVSRFAVPLSITNPCRTGFTFAGKVGGECGNCLSAKPKPVLLDFVLRRAREANQRIEQE